LAGKDQPQWTLFFGKFPLPITVSYRYGADLGPFDGEQLRCGVANAGTGSGQEREK
jgi:hypothetical protein